MREVASMLGVHFSTVNKYILPQELPESGRKRIGRPFLLTRRVCALLVRWFDVGLVLTTTDAINQLKKVYCIEASRQTIARILKRWGLKNYARPLKPRLLARHKRDRYNFAKVLRRMPESFWKNVIFSDESKFNPHGPDGIKRIWRRPGSLLLGHHVRKVVKFGGGSVMVWGAITYRGVGRLVLIEQKMNSEVYVEVLRSGLRRTIEMYNRDLADVIFQQDNDPKHVSKYTMKFLGQLCNARMRLLKWPSCSPDMNIIEHVWDDVNKRVRESLPAEPNIDILIEKLGKEWHSTDPAYIRRLYESIPRRIDALFKAKGGYTKY